MSGVLAQRAERIDAVGYDVTGRTLEAVTECNLCGRQSGLVEIARVDRYGFPSVALLCPTCGLGFLSPRLTADEYAAFYGSVYRPLVSAYHGRLIDATTVQAEQADYAAELVRFVRRQIGRPPASVLDVGGSTGVIAAAFRDAFGAPGTVLDPAPDELAQAAARGLETVAGLAEDFVGTGRRWDLVLLCQTIDHLLDIRSVLAALRALLVEGGHLFVDILDFEFAIQRTGRVEGAVKIDHPYYLTRSSALAYFARAGLVPLAERLSDDGHWGFLLTPTEPQAPDWQPATAGALHLLELIWRLRATGPR